MTVLADRSTDGARPPIGRTVRRRPAVPSGRSLAGAFLVAAAAVLVFAAWLETTGSPGRPWVVARRPLAAGTTLVPGDLTTAAMRLAGQTGAGAFNDPRTLLGRTLAAPVAPGDLLTSAALVPVGAQPALRPVAVTIDPSEASVLATGERVDVLVTDGSSPSAPTDVVARGARVIGITQASSSLSGTGSGDVVTLGVSSLEEVTAIVHSADTGKLSVVVGEPSDGTGLGPSGPLSGGSSPSGPLSGGSSPSVGSSATGEG